MSTTAYLLKLFLLQFENKTQKLLVFIFYVI
jgi:hypothetical protein